MRLHAHQTFDLWGKAEAIRRAARAQTFKTRGRRPERQVSLTLYISDMFATGHDAANRETVRRRQPDELDIVGLALRDDRKVVDKVTKGARMHR